MNPIFILKILLIFWGFFYLHPVTHAASFDCSKASTKIEKVICSNAKLSQLDQDLAILFNFANARDSKIINNQKEWLMKRRNVCQDTDCLIKVYKGRIEELKENNACPIKDEFLYGSWVRVKGGFFEEMNFAVSDGTKVFSSWIHHRPEMVGAWAMTQCIIQIESSSDNKVKFDFKVQKINKDKLYVFDSETNMNAIYQKIQPNR